MKSYSAEALNFKGPCLHWPIICCVALPPKILIQPSGLYTAGHPTRIVPMRCNNTAPPRTHLAVCSSYIYKKPGPYWPLRLHMHLLLQLRRHSAYHLQTQVMALTSLCCLSRAALLLVAFSHHSPDYICEVCRLQQGCIGLRVSRHHARELQIQCKLLKSCVHAG